MTANHRKFFALTKQLGIEDYKSFLFDYTGGQTDSLSELRQVYPQTYNALLQQLQNMSMGGEKQGMDILRKRLIASIFGWASTLGYNYDMAGVKSIACRAAGKDSFNDIPKHRLRSLYNAFTIMKKDKLQLELVTTEALASMCKIGLSDNN